MLAAVAAVRPVQSAILRRSLASTVLLTRQWASETVVELRKEAKSRGLSSKGTKSLLIQRLEQFEAEKSMKFAPMPTREASTVAAAAASASSAVASASSAVAAALEKLTPNSSAPSAEAIGFMNIQIPSAAYPEPEQEAQVPYVPFHLGTREAGSAPEAETATPGFVPKVVVVAGAATHHGGGPAIATVQTIDPAPLKPEDASSSNASSESGNTDGGLFFDVAQDMGLLSFVPKDSPRRTPFWKLFG